MGLLDEAIREHLELKRRRGAAPALVAREEQQALGPVRGGEPAVEDVRDTANADLTVDAAPRGEDRSDASTHAHAEGLSSIGQETAELDMRTVLDEEPDEGVAPVGPVAVEPIISAQAGAHERYARPPGAPDRTDEPVKEVHEETPDFLRDTPEQDRLRFEQRPQRDFDLDK